LVTDARLLILRAVDEWHPTHIAVDLVMPEMDRVEVLVKLADRKCRAKIIIASGVGTRVLDAAGRSANEHGLNISGVLPKRFHRAHFARCWWGRARNSVGLKKRCETAFSSFARLSITRWIASWSSLRSASSRKSTSRDSRCWRPIRGSFTLEYSCRARDEKRWFLLSATPLKTEDGGAAVSHLDITERLAMEEQLLPKPYRRRELAKRIRSIFDAPC
jgi:CheY-like chemotaxis protein